MYLSPTAHVTVGYPHALIAVPACSLTELHMYSVSFVWQLNLSEDLLSRGSMTQKKGRPQLNVRVVNLRENWCEGLLRHELGMSRMGMVYGERWQDFFFFFKCFYADIFSSKIAWRMHLELEYDHETSNYDHKS